MRRTALKGHALRSEGRPYRLRGEGDDPPGPGLADIDVRATGRGGYALCECGTSSTWLTSDGARKRWHVDHKQEMRNG